MLISALLVWPLALFGGRDEPTAVAGAAAAIVFALAASRRRLTALDASLLALLGLLLLQLLPLPGPILDAISPHADRLRSALALTPAASGHPPLTIDVPQSIWAILVYAGAVALFAAALGTFRAGGVRRVARATAATGLLVSLLAIAQAATAGRAIYWRFPTEVEGPLPFGPFVNRNHFGTWAVMALPLTFGYIAARAGTHRRGAPSARLRVAGALDGRGAWLFAAAAAILAALLLSLSRSGVAALAVSGTTTLLAVRRRLDPRRAAALVAAVAMAGGAALALADLPALGQRFAAAGTSMSDRVTIWRETIPIVRDFPITGTGAGTYQTAMRVYQQSDRRVYFNQAHNHYLQVVAEGGIAAAVTLGLALALLVRDGRRAIARDRTAIVWMRIGAACGLGAAALQSVVETGLVMPANAALAAVLAAVVLHERPDGSET